MAIPIGTKVKVIKVDTQGKYQRERAKCFIDKTGIIRRKPDRTGMQWVEFSKQCEKHGDIEGEFFSDELEVVL